MYRSIPKPPMPPPGQTPGHLTFLKNFGQIPRYVARLDGQMPHPLELQRGSKPQPSRLVKANSGNKFCKIFSHYEFLVQLVFVPHFKQRNIPRYNYIKRQQQKAHVKSSIAMTREHGNTRAKRLRMRKVSIFKLAVANANFTTRMPVFELKSNFISIQNFKAGNVKPPGMHRSKDF